MIDEKRDVDELVARINHLEGIHEEQERLLKNALEALRDAASALLNEAHEIERKVR